jgi:hypothetical protein
MNLDTLEEVITDQREEIERLFKSGKLVGREAITNEIERALGVPDVLSIIGVRRCGKSVMAQMLFRNKDYGYINFDDERLRGLKAEDLNTVLEAFYSLYGIALERIILDEIQDVDGWELFANRLRRTKRVIITGSSSKLLSGELATKLTGRHVDVNLLPFSFSEFMTANGMHLGPQDMHSTAKVSQIKKYLSEYTHIGGFPEASTIGKRITASIYGDVVDNDIIGRHNVRYAATLREIVKFLVSNFAKEITLSSLKNIFQLKDKHTIKNYIDYAKESFLIFTIERFSFKLKMQNIAPKKVYCIDVGLIGSVATQVSENHGRILENIVAIELLRRKSYFEPNTDIYYWKDHLQNEVDFVVKSGNRVSQLIQACYEVEDRDVRKRELRALMKASKELRCKNLLVITQNYAAKERSEAGEITFTPLWKWLLSHGAE